MFAKGTNACLLSLVKVRSTHLRAGAFQLLQLQDDIRRQCKLEGGGEEDDVEAHLRQNREALMNSLWKLNVVDIEITLAHVCQMVG